VTAPGPGQRRRGRITRSGDFDAVYRRGRSSANRHLVVYAFARETGDQAGESRLGLSVSRRVGGAVQRNRVKRVLRESFHEVARDLRPGVDLVVIARPGIAEYIDQRGSAAVGERLRELALKVAGPEDAA
jgi:ribonuclease P protein component